MKRRYPWLLCLTLSLLPGLLIAAPDKDNESVARGWVEAALKGRDTYLDYVRTHMADNGTWQNDRYVGFGFSMDPQNDAQMVVVMVIPGSPASKVLKEGDVFVSVAGVPATRENRERLTFRGKPGEPVKAVISRDGKEMPIEVRRGVIDRQIDKETLLENMALSDAEEWPVDEGEIVEVVSGGNVVYVVDELSDTELDTGLTYVERTVTRLEFNDRHQVVRGWNVGEDRFVLEQLGYTISR